MKDGYEDIMNIDISTVAIEMMRRKHESIPQLKCILLNESVFRNTILLFFSQGEVQNL